jgi:hypothetical protein
MSRTPISALAGGTLLTLTTAPQAVLPLVAPQSQVQVTVVEHGVLTPLTVYAGESGSAVLTQPVLTSSDGVVPGFLDIATLATTGADLQLALPGGTETVTLVAPGVIGNGGGGSGAVSTVFGRTGSVTAQTGDYTASQVGADPAGSAAAVAASLPAVYVGAANGASDDVAFNAALTTGAGGIVRAHPGQNYVFSAPVVIPSNTTLDISNCTIGRAAGYTSGPLIKNAAETPQRTVADGSMTSGSPALSSPTAAFVNAAYPAGDVGRAVLVAGAGTGSIPNLYATILTVNSATSATLSQNASTTVANASTKLYNRDKQITLIADAGTTINCGPVTQVSKYSDTLHILFRRVDGLALLGGMALVTAPNACGPIRVGDATQVRIENWVANITVSDFIHLNGPVSFFSITDIFGSTTDDFVAVSGVDVATFSDCYGDCTDGFIGRLFPKKSGNVVDLYKYATKGDGTEPLMRRITIDTLHGASGYPSFAVVYCNNDDVDDILIRNVKVAPGVNGGITLPIVLMTGQDVKKVTIEDISWLGGGGTSGTQAHAVSLTCNGNVGGSAFTGTAEITVRKVHIISASWLTVVEVGGGSVTKLLVEDVDASCRPTNTFNVVHTTGQVGELVVNEVELIALGAPATIVNCAASIAQACRVSGVQYFGTNPLVIMQSGGSCPQISVREVFFQGTTSASCIVSLLSGATAGVVSLNGVRFNSGQNAVVSAIPTAVRISNSDLSALSSTPVVFTGTGAHEFLADPTVRWPNPATTAVTNAAGTLRATGPTLPVDISTLTPVEGDMAHNTNGALACGVGLCAYALASAGNHWKQLVTGVTY